MSRLTKAGLSNPVQLRLTAVSSEEQNSIMKTTHTLMVIAGLILIIAGCTMQSSSKTDDPRTKYVVRFDARAKIKPNEKAAFIEALNKGSWHRDITFNPKEKIDPTPDGTNSPKPARLVHTITPAQEKNPDGVHVTQRVGFNSGQLKDLEEMLSHLADE